MKLTSSFESLPTNSSPIALTIGTFDGMHQGHKQIISQLRTKGTPHLITFRNHPQQALQGHSPLTVTTLPHKLQLLANEGIAHCYLLEFTEEFAKQSAEDFLTYLKEKLAFSSLILGHDATIGHKQNGNRTLLAQLSKKLDFELTYISPYYVEDKIVSSSLIREKIEKTELAEAALLLGRPYSIYATVIHGHKSGTKIGYPTANLDVQGLVLPKKGVWVCELLYKGTRYRAIANLGHAPTLYTDRACVLEVHLLDVSLSLYGESVELFFHHFLRPELHFSTIAALQNQIAQDISSALTNSHSAIS